MMIKRTTAALALILALLSAWATAEALPEPGARDVPLGDNGVPVVSITIEPEEFEAVLASPNHTYRAEHCSIRIDVPEGYVCEYGDIDPDALGRDLPLEYLRGRGHATWMMDKKPFKFRLSDSADLLAMGQNAHWVLMANATDGSMLRNKLASYMGSALGLPFEARFVPVDLVVNGRYLGAYMLGQEVRVGESRVAIRKMSKQDIALPQISGGYLLALEPHDTEDEVNVFTTTRGVRFLTETPDFTEYGPSKQAALEAQRAYIADYLQQVEDAVYGPDFQNAAGARCADLMDYESAVRYWWVQEFTGNDDAYITPSTYLYKDADGKLCWGPLWDFDHAFFPMGKNGYLGFATMPWLDHLRENDPEYQALLRQTWTQYNQVLIDITREGGVMDRWAEEMRSSWENDYLLWGEEALTETTFDDTIDMLKSIIEDRRQAIDEAMNGA